MLFSNWSRWGTLFARQIRYLWPRADLVHCAMLLRGVALPILPNVVEAGGVKSPLFAFRPARGHRRPALFHARYHRSVDPGLACAVQGRHAVPFYALSNVGSRGALISYPFLFEPLRTSGQATMWSGISVFVLCAFTAWRSGRRGGLAIGRGTGPPACQYAVAAAVCHGFGVAAGHQSPLRQRGRDLFLSCR
jgi:hypothetical protein